MRIDTSILTAITIAYPILGACAIVAAGIFLADAIERHDPARLLMVAMFTLFGARFFLLGVSLGPSPALIDRFVAQAIAGSMDAAAAILAPAYLAIVVYRRWHRRRPMASPPPPPPQPCTEADPC